MARILRPLSEEKLWSPVDGSAFGSVEWLVPWSERFENFVRIFHPPRGISGEFVTWGELAKTAGIQFNAETQFSAIAQSHLSARAPLGDMGHDALKALTDLIMRDGDQPCVFAIWEGESWRPNQTGSTATVTRLAARQRVEKTVSDLHIDNLETEWDAVVVEPETWNLAYELKAPRAHRVYRLFGGWLSDLDELHVMHNGNYAPHQPTLAWAEDFSVCLATDPDYDSTILAGSVALCHRVLNAPGIEALSIARHGSLLA